MAVQAFADDLVPMNDIEFKDVSYEDFISEERRI
jgi:hypothetical protein